MEEKLIKVEELAVRVDVSVPTISAWYRWKAANPDHELAQILPDFIRKGPHRTRCWSVEDVERVIEFKNSIPQGRNGVMGSVTQKYVKKHGGKAVVEESVSDEIVEDAKEETTMSNTKYIQKYQKENTIQINLRLSKKYDADIIDWLNSLGDEGKATYLKRLIREDMSFFNARRCS